MSRDSLIALLPAVYPLCLIPGLVGLPGANVLVRLGLIVAVAPGLVRLAQITPTHRRWFAVLGVYLAALTLSSIASVDPSLSFTDLQRQAFLAAVAAGLSLALMEPRARSAFALAALAVSAVATLSVLSLYGRFEGDQPLGPALESFKSYAANRFDVPLNAVSFAAVLAAVLAVPFLARRPAMLVLLLVPVVAAVAASGSRTTAASLIVAIPLTAFILLLHRLRRIPMWIPYGSIAVVAGWTALSLTDQLGRLGASPAMNDLTTGRSLLWAAAWDKFLERPLFGWGGRSFPIDLGGFLPATKVYEASDLQIVNTTGGAHNALLTVLAERGLITALAAVMMSGFLLLLAIRVHRSRARLRGIDRAYAWLGPFVILLILVRSLGEMPGWFGYADSLVDFLAYGCAAMLVAVAADLTPRTDPQWPTAAPAATFPADRLADRSTAALWGAQRCSNCGLSLPVMARFCRRCGSPQERTVEPRGEAHPPPPSA
jgi:O-antigen ligase